MEKIKLYDKNIYNGCENVTLECYIKKSSPELKMPPRPAVVICPGGAYSMTSDREAEPVADIFLAAGYNAFVLRYSCGQAAKGGNPLFDAALAIAAVRKNAVEYYIDPNKIAVCGFSAGGHLAAYISVMWQSDLVNKTLGLIKGDAKPNAMILGYPVISAVVSPHVNSFINLSGGNDDHKKYSVETLVTAETPPAFIWHTADDTVVNVKNSLIFAEALSDNKILFEIHVFPKGFHGLSICTFETAPEGLLSHANPYVGRWTDMAIKWLNNLFFNGDFKNFI